jgi:hypothetical protein
MTTPTYTVDALLDGKDAVVAETYARLLAALRTLGAVEEEAKKTSVHLTAGPGTSAFAGVHPRRAALLLNIRSAAPIESPRVRKVEQVSKNRFHNELLLESPSDVDAELVGWLRAAYGLAAGAP